MKYNEHIVNVSIHVSSGVSYTTSEQQFGAEVLKHGDIDLRPRMPMYQYTEYNKWLWVKDNSYKLSFKGTTGTGGAYANFCYARK